MTRQKRPPMKRAATAGDLLGQFLQQAGLAGKLHAYESWRVWDEVVGPLIAAHAQPARIRDGVLEVRVDQAVWMQQLQLMKPKILSRLNERLGGEPIADIFWRRGRLDERPAASSAGNERPWLERTLDEAEQARIETAIAPLDDDELRARLRAILRHQAQLDKTLKKNN